MRTLLLAAAIGLAAIAAPAQPGAKAGELKFKNSLLEWDVSWPAEVSAIPALLASIRDPALKVKRDLLKTAAADRIDRKKQGFPFFAYSSSSEVALAGDSGRLLSLTEEVSEFTGGAHPNSGMVAILWDRNRSRKVNVASLFRAGDPALQTLLRKNYCAALTKERRKRRGAEGAVAGADDPFNQCPKFGELALVPEGKAGKPFAAIMVHADPYVAGPYVEGDYDIDLPVTAALVAALKPQYRASFEPAR
ncbi:MAG: DUF4163 domain-containing protein [Sphingomicrobium sp.]